MVSPFYATAESYGAWRVIELPADLMKKEGANTPIEALRQVPSFVGTTRTENDSSGGNGSGFINLYALGANNVLTLINGRRAFAFSNINAIPISALARTEILGTGIYGSDSAAGAVNFLMLNGPGEAPYEGAELFTLYGNTTDADAHVRQVYLRGGVTGLDGKVSIAAAGEYYSRANLFSRDRDISGNADLSDDATGLGLGGRNNNSPTYGGRISVLSGATALGFTNTGQLVLSDLTNNQVTPGSYRRFDVPAGTDPSRFNFRAFTPAVPAVEKAMYYVTGRYKMFGDGLQLYGDVMYSHTKQDNGFAGTLLAISSATNGLIETKASMFNPAGNFLTSVRYRLQQELGDRKSFFDQDYQRYVAGINGDFDIRDNGFISRFGYDSGFVYEQFHEQRTDSGDALRTRIRQAIAGLDLNGDGIPETFFTPFIGQNAPIVGTAPVYVNGVPTGGTAAYDNRAGAAFASYIGHSSSFERDFLYDLKVNAHLLPNLWNGGIDFAGGYEHRTINQKQIPDPVEASGDPLFFNQTSSFKYRQEVESWFFDLSVPLITSTMNVPLVRSLDLEIVWRREEFSETNVLLAATSPVQRSAGFVNENPDENFGGSPSIALRYQPFWDLTFRASWRQSIRPPAFDELFTPVRQVFPAFFGPGLLIQPPAGYWEGGNPALKPETTDTYSVGAVWTPRFAPGLAVTVDAYQMFTTNLILNGDVFAQVLLARNVVDPDGCGLGVVPGGGPAPGVTRDEVGNLLCIDSPFGNAGKRHVQGVDVSAVYELPTEGFGKFTFSGGWNHFFTWKAQPGTGAFNNFLGNYNNGTLPLAPGAVPWNKGFLRGEWEWRHLDFVATGNYIGDFRDDPNVFGTFTGVRMVPSYITLDMQLSYEFVKPMAESPTYAKESKNVTQTAAETSSIWQRMLWGTKITVGVNNAFDRNPPTVLAALNDNYDTSLYSIRNRYYYVALSKKF